LQAGYPFRTTVEEVPDGDVHVIQMKDVSPELGVDWSAVMRTRLAGRKQPDWIVDGDILFAAKGARFYAACVGAALPNAVCVPAFFHLRVRPELRSTRSSWPGRSTSRRASANCCRPPRAAASSASAARCSSSWCWPFHPSPSSAASSRWPAWRCGSG
jgi:hypothetical protein